MPVSRSMLACLMAFKAGSTDCNDAFPMLEKFFKKAGVDTNQVAFADGRAETPRTGSLPSLLPTCCATGWNSPRRTSFVSCCP